MRILLLAPQPFFQQRGTPIAVRMLIESLSLRGDRITVLTYPEGEDIEIPGCNIVRIRYVPGLKNVKPGPSLKKFVYDLLMLRRARKLVHEDDFDVIHAVEEAAFMGRNIWRSFGIPYVYDMDSSLPQQVVEKYPYLEFLYPLLRKLERSAIRESIGVLAVCKVLQDDVIRGNPKKLVQRVEDVSLLPDTADMDEVDESKRLNLLPPVVMYVGNLEKYQGIDLLLESFEIASRELKDVHLVVIGGAEDDIEYYKNRSRTLGIHDKTLFTGPRPVSELSIYLAQADILVSPRVKGRNTPMKIYSYLDSGKPVLATDLPTHTQVLDGEIALTVRPDAQSMASGMVRLLKDEGLRERLAAKAKERIQQEYTQKAFRRKLFSFYDNVEAMLTEKRLPEGA